MIELVGEIGINANGDINIAKKLIRICHYAGIQYVKFQKRNIDYVYSKEELESKRESPWGSTFRAQKAGLEFGFDEYCEIDNYCKQLGIKWFASAWDRQSVEFLNEFEAMPFFKIPSALVTYRGYLSILRGHTLKPVIISTGMSTEQEVDYAVNFFPRDRVYAILACTSTYPCPPSEINLRYISTLKEKYPWAKIGFSNHSAGLPYIVGAAALGAEMIEFHITLDRSGYGSDQASSIEPEGILRIAKYIDGMKLAVGDGVKKVFSGEEPIIKKLRK